MALGSSRASLLDSVWDLVEAALSAIVLAGALLVLLWLLRWSMLMWRRRSPRLQITQFAWAGEGEGREALWVTSLFRDHLKALRLDGLDPLPDRAPGAPLVEIVEGVGQGVGQSVDLAKALGRLYRVVVPDSGYEVWATLRPTAAGKGAISVQLTDRGRGNRALASLTSKEGVWEAVSKEAAMAVSGALYPQLSSRHKGPWARWKRPVPADLLATYQDALEHERENRLEQAMGGFREALEMDPLNPELRLKVAMLEERLELHLDAWFTYRAIVDERARKLWRGPERRVRLLALYRLAIHLVNPAVADDWVETLDRHATEGAALPGCAHESDQVKMRRLLEAALSKDWFLDHERPFRPSDRMAMGSSAGLADALAETRWVKERKNTEGPEARRQLIDPFLRDYDEENDEERVRLIREVLQVLSLRYLEELEDRMRRAPFFWATWCWPDKLRRRPPLRRLLRRREFYRPLVKASMLLVRCRIAAAAVHRPRANGAEELNATLEAEREALLCRWPIAMRESRRRQSGGWDWIPYPWHRLRLWLAERHRHDAWVLRYNAACTIASLLLSREPILDGLTGEEKKALTRRALEQLEGFAHLARGKGMTDRADWIVAGDPDLGGIHKTPEFRLWATHHFGFDIPKDRPERLVDPERFTVVMIKRGAEALAAKWRDRASSGRGSVREVAGWWREEKETWIAIDQVLRHRRSWRYRLKVLNEVARWNEENGEAVDLAHEAWSAEKKRGPLSPEFFAKLSEHLHPENPTHAWAKRRANQIRAEQDSRLRDGGGMAVQMSRNERDAAVRAANAWARLAESLEKGLEGKENACLVWLNGDFPTPRADDRT